jgi:hypothetical protein
MQARPQKPMHCGGGVNWGRFSRCIVWGEEGVLGGRIYPRWGSRAVLGLVLMLWCYSLGYWGMGKIKGTYSEVTAFVVVHVAVCLDTVIRAADDNAWAPPRETALWELLVHVTWKFWGVWLHVEMGVKHELPLWCHSCFVIVVMVEVG